MLRENTYAEATAQRKNDTEVSQPLLSMEILHVLHKIRRRMRVYSLTAQCSFRMSSDVKFVVLPIFFHVVKIAFWIFWFSSSAGAGAGAGEIGIYEYPNIKLSHILNSYLFQMCQFFPHAINGDSGLSACWYLSDWGLAGKLFFSNECVGFQQIVKVFNLSGFR